MNNTYALILNIYIYSIYTYKYSFFIEKIEFNNEINEFESFFYSRGAGWEEILMSCFVIEMRLKKRTIDYNPKKTKFRKQHRGRMKGISRRGNSISFGRKMKRKINCCWNAGLFVVISKHVLQMINLCWGCVSGRFHLLLLQQVCLRVWPMYAVRQ